MHNPNDSKKLLNIIKSAVGDSAWFMLYFSKEQPFRLAIYTYRAGHSYMEEAFLIDVYIFLLPIEGNQYQLQLAESKRLPPWSAEENPINKRYIGDGEKILILGWWEEGKVFVGFDHDFHAESLESGVSFRIDKEILLRANVQGITTHRRGEEEIAIAFKPMFFAMYVELLDGLHDFGRCEEDRLILEKTFA